MKNTLKFFVLITVIGLVLAACAEDDKSGNTNPVHTCTFGDWTEKTAATCTAVKVQERSCSCGEKQTQNVGEPLGHDWKITETLPTCTKEGSRSENCKRCPETITNQVLNPTGHNYQKNICVACKNIEMAQIPEGTFTMGPSIQINGTTTFDVTLSAFKMSKFTITQELYEAVMGINPSYFHGGEGREPAEGEVQGKRPVETVTWFDVIEFCNKLSEREGLEIVYTIEGRTPVAGYPITSATVTANWEKNGYRLPTEAQWEYTCRAGSTTDWYFGDDENELGNYAWYGINSNGRTHEVGKKLPNAFGLYDMHGNVWELCWDWYGDYPTEAKTDYTRAGAGTYRVGRGGCFPHYEISIFFSLERYDFYPAE